METSLILVVGVGFWIGGTRLECHDVDVDATPATAPAMRLLSWISACWQRSAESSDTGRDRIGESAGSSIDLFLDLILRWRGLRLQSFVSGAWTANKVGLQRTQ